ncbi:MAG: adenylate/guanylate cyclase domain-containing protein [Betaproteobacteria bacterium]|nr:adenylate/guanylate cyclase domain-containing protein [Betaproteobacteria bacterium]
MRAAASRRAGLLLSWIQLGAVGGALFGAAAGAAVLDPPLLGASLAALSGAIDGMTLTTLIIGSEIFLPRTRLGRALDRSPFLVTFATKSIVYSLVIIALIGGRFGTRLVGLLIGTELALVFRSQIRTGLPWGLVVAIAFLVTPLLYLLRQLGKVIGDRTFRDIALGRYHRPRTEERFFLFVDIVGSTPLAEKIGPAAVHRFLDRVFQLASDPIDDHAGEVYQYVGDEIVITWTLAEGRTAARPIACYFALKSALDRAAKEFEQEFGVVPQLRAALHAGPVITGEVGGSRRAIVFHGDVMNTTSRIENATRDLVRPFLVSEDALSRLDGTEAYTMVDLGEQQLRGREARVRVYAPEIAGGVTPQT